MRWPRNAFFVSIWLLLLIFCSGTIGTHQTVQPLDSSEAGGCLVRLTPMYDLEFGPIADSYVKSSSGARDMNFGNVELLTVAQTDVSLILTSHAYVKFNVSAIDFDGSVNSITLEMSVSSVYAAHRVGIHLCSDQTWLEYGITWNNQPGFDSTVTDEVNVATSGQRCIWDVTDEVLDAISSAIANITFVLVSEDFHHDDWINFMSKEYTLDYELQPRLVVDYTPSDQQDPVISNIQHTPALPAAEQIVTVIADIVDVDSGLFNASLYYRVNSSSWNSLDMSLVSGTTYQGPIPGQPKGTIVEYYIKAFDNVGNSAQSSTSSYTVGVETTTSLTTSQPGIPGFPFEAIALGALIALGVGLARRRKL